MLTIQTSSERLFRPPLLLAGLLIVGASACTDLAPWTPAADRQLEGWGTVSMERAAKLQHALDEAVNDRAAVGLQASLRTAQGETWTGASGSTTLEREVDLSKEHVFRVASISKMFTTVVVLQLVGEGALSLDDRVSRWLPGLENAEQIELRHLLSHQSGIPEILADAGLLVQASTETDKVWTSADHWDWLEGRGADFEPGRDRRYSNSGFILAGLIAEEVTGLPMHVLIQQRITDPLGLSKTWLLPQARAPEGLVAGYDRSSVPFPGWYEVRPEHRSWASLAFTAGALCSTSEELLSFVTALAEGGLVSLDLWDQMSELSPAVDERMPEIRAAGLGLFEVEAAGSRWIGHAGSFVGFEGYVLYRIDDGAAAVVLGNVSTFGPLKVIEALLLLAG